MSEEKIYPSMVIRSQAEAIELLQQENRQLKEKLNCDLNWALKYDELYKQNQQLKENNLSYQEEMCRVWEKNEQIKEENQQLKEKYNIRSKAYNNILLENASLHTVLDEIRELKDRYNLGKYDYSIPVFEIEEILDKVKE